MICPVARLDPRSQNDHWRYQLLGGRCTAFPHSENRKETSLRAERCAFQPNPTLIANEVDRSGSLVVDHFKIAGSTQVDQTVVASPLLPGRQVAVLAGAMQST